MLFCSYFVFLYYFYCCVCTSVGLLPPGESPIAVNNNNNNNNNFGINYRGPPAGYLHHWSPVVLPYTLIIRSFAQCLVPFCSRSEWLRLWSYSAAVMSCI